MKNIQIGKISDKYTVRTITEADTAFIGFFMMNKSLQGRGVGTALVSEVLAYLTALGFAAVRLGIDKENPQSNHFWRKNGFTVLKEVPQARGVILLAERRLMQK